MARYQEAGKHQAEHLLGPKGTYRQGIDVCGKRNVFTTQLRDFQYFFDQFNVSPKSKANCTQTMKQLWGWLLDNEEIRKLPKFPKVNYQLRRKTTLERATQLAVLDKIGELSGTAKQPNKKTAFRIWLGIRWMIVYVNVRPAEVRDIKEKPIDLKRAEILIPHPKEGREKKIYLLDEDVDYIRSLPRGMRQLYFFRHEDGSQVREKCFLNGG